MEWSLWKMTSRMLFLTRTTNMRGNTRNKAKINTKRTLKTNIEWHATSVSIMGLHKLGFLLWDLHIGQITWIYVRRFLQCCSYVFTIVIIILAVFTFILPNIASTIYIIMNVRICDIYSIYLHLTGQDIATYTGSTILPSDHVFLKNTRQTQSLPITR